MSTFRKFSRSLLGCIALSRCLVSATHPADTSCVVDGHNYHVDETITKDVAIIGGGSSGTYAAIQLQDAGRSVAVIEQKGRLGGHTETYIDPATGVPIDYGVVVFHHLDTVTKYFARLNVSAGSTADAGGVAASDVYADLATGQLAAAPTGDLATAFGVYAQQLAKYPYLDYGYDLPYPVPEDLLMPFVDFAKKYDLGALLPYVWRFAQGAGDLNKVPTIYVMKVFSLDSVIESSTGFLTTAAHYNSLIYLAATTILSNSVHYNSTVVAIERTATKGHSIIVKDNNTGRKTLIKASQLIISIPPTLSNLSPMHLTHAEAHLFKKFTSNQYYTGILKNSGIPDNSSIDNITPSNPYSLPAPPALYALTQSGIPGYVHVKYITTSSHTDDATIQASILSQVQNVQVPGKGTSKPEFVVASNHKPFLLQVSAEEIQGGFYKKLGALQGKKGTWWIGATFHAHDSSYIWRFVDGLLPNVTAALG